MTGPGHHRVDSRARVGVVKARRVAPPLRAVGLDNASGETGEGIYVMARESTGLTAVVSDTGSDSRRLALVRGF